MFRVQRIGPKNDPYMFRVHATPWDWWPWKKRAYIHVFLRPDAELDFHDHPFAFWSFVLWGGYEETVPEPGCHYALPDGRRRAERVIRRRRWLSRASFSAEHRHYISRLLSKPTVTLVIRGEKTRDWGFYVPTLDGERMIPWTDYLGLPPQPSAYGSAV